MKTLLFLVVVIAVAAVWAIERKGGIELRAVINTLRHENLDLSAARVEHARLRQLHSEARQRAEVQKEIVERAGMEQRATRPAFPPVSSPASLTVGEWHPSTSWRNRGQTTPASTVETMLWAATGGDIELMQSLLLLDDAGRAKAESVRATLSEESRTTYPTAEHLLAAFTTKSIPVGEAQLVWSHQRTSDEAFACLFVKNPEPPVTTPEIPATAGENAPPMAPPNAASRATYLVLRRSDAGWRLVVPASAVDTIAKELTGQRSR